MILTSLVVIIMFLIIGNRFWYYDLRQKLKNVPISWTLPFFGNFFEMYGNQEHIYKQFRKINKRYDNCINFQMYVPGFTAVALRDPDDVETLFKSIKHIEKSIIYDFLRPWLMDGLLNSAGTKWRGRRKILTPGFHFNILQKYMENILEHAENIAGDLKNEEGDRVKDLQTWVADHTLDIICETAMGVSFQNSKKDAVEYQKAVDAAGATVFYRSVRPWLIWNSLFFLTKVGKRYLKSLETLHNFSTKIINERKKFHEETNGMYLTELNDIGSEQFGTQSKCNNLAMLDILIHAFRNGEIDDLGIREEVDTFIFEGYDTTAAAMCYTILCLAENTKIQTRAREEIDEVWEKNNGKIGMAEVQKFAYLERCIKETLRLYPSVPMLTRKINDDLKLKNCVLPAGIEAHIYIIDIHRDPALWPKPEVFDPERFLPENSQGRHPFSYIPFSGGFRNCIGQKFAMLELKAVIGFLLHNFFFDAIDTTKDITPIGDIVLRSKNPLRVKFVPIGK